MEYVKFGGTGLKVSRICLGMMTFGDPKWREWVLDDKASRPIVERAVELGINFFDTADMYSVGGSEHVTGRLLKGLLPRDEMVVATKVFHPTGDGVNQRGLSRKHIMDAIDRSLSKLGMDYVDLYQIHRFDYDTPIEETMEALHDVVKAGKARYIGASSMHAWQFAMMQFAAEKHGWTKFVSMQNHYNLVYREEEREMIPYCLHEQVALIPWSPLARGFLAGNRPKGQPAATIRGQTDQFAIDYYFNDMDYAVLDAVEQVAKARGAAMAQIATAWVLQRPGITAPIMGASKLKHVEDAVAALDIKLTPDEMAALEAHYLPKPVMGHE
jgi:1-deoxyxylulose-5-phosphate synthase